MKKIIFTIALVLIPKVLLASGGEGAIASSETISVIRNSMIALCLAIAFVTIAVKSSLTGDGVDVRNLALRLLFVVLALMAAGRIQGFISGMGESIAGNILPGPDLMEMHESLGEKIGQMAKKDVDMDDVEGDGWVEKAVNWIGLGAITLIEQAALTIYYLAFKWFKLVKDVVMDLLAVLAPFMIVASIIPGIKGFTNWLKLVAAVSLWPVIASFFIKSQLMSAMNFYGEAGNVDLTTYYAGMNAVRLLAETLAYGLFLMATPFIATAIVSGSAGAFAVGSAFLMGAGPLTIFKKTKYMLSGGMKVAGITGKAVHGVGSMMPEGIRAVRSSLGSISGKISSSAKFRSIFPRSPRGGGS